MYRRFGKRILDIVISVVILILISIPMLFIAIAIKLDSKGAVIFKTKRIGKNGKLFPFYKFRTMRTDAPHDCPSYLLPSGKYITRVGSFLRKTSLDELPQLYCVIKGDMSLVGPRPTGSSEMFLLHKREELGVNEILPGLTGLAQVNGRDVLAKDAVKKALCDAEYKRNYSFWLDLKILFKTVKVVLTREGYEEGENDFLVSDDQAKPCYKNQKS